jgi:hypothetical protein
MSGFEIVLIVLAALALVGGAVTLIVLRLRAKRKEKVQFDFSTKHGIDVKLSPMFDGVTAVPFEKWTEDLISFWNEKRGWDRNKMLSCVSKVGIFLYDELYLERSGVKVNGVTWPNRYEIEMATKPKEDSGQTPFEKVKSLFRHEMSHVLVGHVGEIPFDNETHHALFAQVGLGA